MNPPPVVIDEAGIRNSTSGKGFVMVDLGTVDDDDDGGDDPRNEREDDEEVDLQRQIHLTGVPRIYADGDNDE